jgi:hypothetical protein
VGATANPVWAELVQLVPVVTLASSFLVSGEVDLARAGPLFAVAAGLTVVTTGLVAWRGHVPNPILLGAALWLWLGAAVFGSGWSAGAALLGDARGAALFAFALLVGVPLTLGAPTGYVGARSDDPAWVRRTSLALLVLTAAAIGWSWTFRADLRLGSGLPFILLNLARRAFIAQAK